MYGSGCWAQNETDDAPGVACSTTGIIMTFSFLESKLIIHYLKAQESKSCEQCSPINVLKGC
jgi:hypothetical protein